MRSGGRKLKFDTSARFKKNASYELTVNTPTKKSSEKSLHKLPAIMQQLLSASNFGHLPSLTAYKKST